MSLSKQNIELLLEPLNFKRRKNAVGSDWDSKNSQNVQKFGCFWKQMGFPKKKFNFFEIAKGKLFPVRSDWKGNKTSRNVQNVVFLSEVYGFFKKNSSFFKFSWR